MMRYRIAWLIVLLILNIVPTIAQDNLSIEIIETPIYNQDTGEVTVNVVVQGERSLELTNLAPVNFEIGEPSANLTVTSQRRLPTAIAIIIDMSFGTDDDLVRDTLRSFLINYYQPDDDVTFYILDGATNTPRIVEVNSLADANDVIDGLRQQEPYYFISDTVNQALGSLVAKGSSPVRPRMIVTHLKSQIAIATSIL